MSYILTYLGERNKLDKVYLMHDTVDFLQIAISP